MMFKRLSFYSSCVDWPRDDVNTPGGLSDMIDAQESITRRTFRKHVDCGQLSEIERSLGYALRGGVELTMARDWAVGYYRSILHGERVYYFTHSAIEYVFTLTLRLRKTRQGYETRGKSPIRAVSLDVFSGTCLAPRSWHGLQV